MPKNYGNSYHLEFWGKFLVLLEKSQVISGHKEKLQVQY